ncbi:ribonuclease 3-like [Haematobia irritans]|uniref:ribonuclease 3-like n=1 Tax=Haematobia irritans TaxID=7368 RepID=UPI003F4FC100
MPPPDPLPPVATNKLSQSGGINRDNEEYTKRTQIDDASTKGSRISHTYEHSDAAAKGSRITHSHDYSEPPPGYDGRSDYPHTSYKYRSYPSSHYYQYPPPPVVVPPPRSYNVSHRYSSSVPRNRGDYYSRTTSSYSTGSRYDSQNHSNQSVPPVVVKEKRSRLREDRPQKPETERDRLLRMWRSNYCETPEEIQRKMEELSELEENSREVWIRSSPADPYYRRTNTVHEVEGSARLLILCELFEEELLKRSDRIREKLPPYKPAPRLATRRRVCKHKSEGCSSSDSDSSDNEDFKLEQDNCMEELSRKVQHPYRIHADLWHNEAGEMNDGPLCRCSQKSRRVGIRHGIYPGEKCYTKCDPNSNNANKLYHYRITISPPTNFLTKTPTIIKHDEHEFLFEGFSLLSHFPLGDLPTCKVIRFNIEYTIMYVEEKMPENFTIKELDLFFKYMFHELLELVDFSLLPKMDETVTESCPAFHFLPRFVRDLPDNGKEVLAMCEVLKYLLDNAGPLVDKPLLTNLEHTPQTEWQDYVDNFKGMLATKPGYKPSSIRVDHVIKPIGDIYKISYLQQIAENHVTQVLSSI